MSFFNLIKINATSSTNDFLKERHLKRSCQDGDLVWAKDQTAGRGQRGNGWISNPKNSLTISVYKAYEILTIHDAFAISVACSLAIVQALNSIRVPDLSIKWPNDILSANKKIGGILIENYFKKNRLSASIIGIGLNINHLFSNDIPHAGSLELATGIKREPEQVLREMIPFLEKKLNFLTPQDQDLNEYQYHQFLWRKDKMSVFKRDQEELTAIVRGVTKNGNLILEDEQGIQKTVTSNRVKMKYIL
jgi:BirA family biotin operon repressor/biotin-[acetyl-CoA-carboxylase] ligase